MQKYIIIYKIVGPLLPKIVSINAGCLLVSLLVMDKYFVDGHLANQSRVGFRGRRV